MHYNFYSGNSSDVGGRGSESREKVSSKGSSLRNKEMAGHAEISLYSEKQPASSKPQMISPASPRFSIANEADEQAAEKISLLEVLSKAHSAKSAAGRNFAVNDDITLSDDEGRSHPKQKRKNQYMDNVGVSEELDAIPCSSKATFKEDCPFRVKLEDIVGQQNKHPVLKPKDHHCCAEKMAKLKEEKAQSEDAQDDQCGIEHKRMKMESELANLRSSSKQQEEDCLNTMRMAQLSIRELEEELQQAQEQLSQERYTILLLQKKLKGQDSKPQPMEEDKKPQKNAPEEDLRQARVLRSPERCTNAQLQQKRKCQDCKQQTMGEDNKRTKHTEEHLKTDLEATQAHSSTKEKDLTEENEGLNEQLGDIRQDAKPTSDNQAQSVLEWNNMITGLKGEVTHANARLVEAEQLRLEMEKVLLQEKEEQKRLRDKLATEKANQQEALTNLTEKLSEAKAYGNSMENELLEREAQYIKAMKQMKKQACFLDERKKEQSIATRKQNEAQTAEAEETVQKPELDKATSARQHSNKSDALQTVDQKGARCIHKVEICEEISDEESPLPTHPDNLKSSGPESPTPEEGEIDDVDDDDLWSDANVEVPAHGSRAADGQPASRGPVRQRENDLSVDLHRCGFHVLEQEISTLNSRLQSLQMCALPLLTSIEDNLRRIAQSPASPVRSRWTLRRRWGRSGGEGRRTAGDMESLITDE